MAAIMVAHKEKSSIYFNLLYSAKLKDQNQKKDVQIRIDRYEDRRGWLATVTFTPVSQQ
jgi:hypothetical protein